MTTPSTSATLRHAGPLAGGTAQGGPGAGSEPAAPVDRRFGESYGAAHHRVDATGALPAPTPARPATSPPPSGRMRAPTPPRTSTPRAAPTASTPPTTSPAADAATPPPPTSPPTATGATRSLPRTPTAAPTGGPAQCRACRRGPRHPATVRPGHLGGRPDRRRPGHPRPARRAPPMSPRPESGELQHPPGEPPRPGRATEGRPSACRPWCAPCAACYSAGPRSTSHGAAAGGARPPIRGGIRRPAPGITHPTADPGRGPPNSPDSSPDQGTDHNNRRERP